MLFVNMVSSSPADNVDPRVAWSIFVKDVSACKTFRLSTWVKSTSKDWLSLDPQGISEPGVVCQFGQ